MDDVSARQIARFLGAAVVTTCAMLTAACSGGGRANADTCPDIEVVFARARDEPPGVGGIGQAFVDSLRPQVGGRSLGVYAVNYAAADPAPPDSPEGAAVTSAGAKDASAHVEYMAANCPHTRMVLGGFSRGAIVIDLITSAAVPPHGYIPAPMPPEVADHVAAVAVFGNAWVKWVGAPLIANSPLYGAKAIDLCTHGDPVCSDGADTSAHSVSRYVQSGMVNQAATFAASRLVLASAVTENRPHDRVMQTLGTWLQLIGNVIIFSVLLHVVWTGSRRIKTVRDAVVDQLTQLGNAIASLGAPPPPPPTIAGHLTSHADLSADVTLKRGGTDDERLTRLENDHNTLLNELAKQESRFRAEISEAKAAVLKDFQTLSNAIRLKEAYLAVGGILVSIAGYICQLIG
jgi:cutinase-like protein